MSNMVPDIDSSHHEIRVRYEEFLRLFAAHESRVFAHVLTLLPHWADAEEVFQETCVVLWRSFDQFEIGTDFRAWACRIALHQVIAFRRKRKRERIRFGQDFIEVVAKEADEKAGDLNARLDALGGCIAKLRPRDQELLTLCYRSGATTKSVAERLGRPADTLYKALKRVRRSLFECINRTLVAGE